MIKLASKIPNNVYIAVSGGLDSMVALDFLGRSKNRNIEVLHFNHGTEHGRLAEDFVTDFCAKNGINYYVGQISSSKKRGESPEEYWRRERYCFFNKFKDKKIITCHHLDDQVENYIFTMLNGREMLIPYERDNFIRPFLSSSKEELKSWAERKRVVYISDPSNYDLKYMRNLIRHELVPIARKVNPGLQKVVKKKVENLLNNVDNTFCDWNVAKYGEQI